MAPATSRAGPVESPLNPLHSCAEGGFSDALQLLAASVMVATAPPLKLPRARLLPIEPIYSHLIFRRLMRVGADGTPDNTESGWIREGESP